MIELAPFIKDLAVVLIVAAVVSLIFQKIKQPVVLGYLVAGLIIGPNIPPHGLIHDINSIEMLATLGVIFLMFSLGLEFSFHKLTRVGFAACIIGIVEVILMCLIGFLLANALGWSFFDSLFLGAAISISSTTIIIKALAELNLKNRKFAELISGVLVVEDLLAIMLLAALPMAVSTNQILSMTLVWQGLTLLFVVASWFLIGYFCIPLLMKKVLHTISDESLTIVALALCLLLVLLAANHHYSIALGAFVMGSILAETPQVKRIENLLSPVRDMFGAIFFVAVGMMIDPKMFIVYWPIVLLITVVTMLGKILTSLVAALLTGQSFTTSTKVGFGMAQIGEFSFIIIGLGLSLHAVSPGLYPIIVAVSLITTFFTPYLIKFSNRSADLIESRLPNPIRFFLNSYAALTNRSFASIQSRSIYRRAISRFVINALITGIIFTASEKLLLPILYQEFTKIWLAKALGWFVTMMLAFPFIWAMLFSFRFANYIIKIKTKLIHPAILLSWLLTFYEIDFLSLAYFDNRFIALIALALAVILFIVLYRRLGKSYQWLETQLISNLANNQSSEEGLTEKFRSFSPWDTRIYEVTVSPNAQCIGKTLLDLKFRQNFGINIVAIIRGSTPILAPTAQEIIFPHDKLVILGEDQAIENFNIWLEHAQTGPEHLYYPSQFSLQTIIVTESDDIVGKSIKNSGLREQMGLIVGLERNSHRITNPDSDFLLEAGDVLYILSITHSA